MPPSLLTLPRPELYLSLFAPFPPNFATAKTLSLSLSAPFPQTLPRPRLYLILNAPFSPNFAAAKALSLCQRPFSHCRGQSLISLSAPLSPLPRPKLYLFVSAPFPIAAARGLSSSLSRSGSSSAKRKAKLWRATNLILTSLWLSAR